MVYGILSFKIARSQTTTQRALPHSIRFPSFASSEEYATASAIGWIQVQIQRLHSLYGHMRLALSFRLFMQIYSNDQLYAVVVRACAVREKNTAKIQSFCSVSRMPLEQILHLWVFTYLLCAREVVVMWRNSNLTCAFLFVTSETFYSSLDNGDNVEVNESVAWCW